MECLGVRRIVRVNELLAVNESTFKKRERAAVTFPAGRGSAVSVSHREPERYGFTLDEHFSGAARVLSMQSTDILMKDKCQPSVIARLRVLQASRKHETRRQDTFSGRT